MQTRPVPRAAWGGFIALASLSIMLAACSSANDQPGAVTADEARQLNEAAAMLDANSVDADAVTANESQS